MKLQRGVALISGVDLYIWDSAKWRGVLMSGVAFMRGSTVV